MALNGGPVLKVNANVRYATDAPGSALVALAAEQARVPLQRFAMRSDLPCGSTIGPVTAARLGITTVDVGMPQLAMHAAREHAGSHDPAHYRGCSPPSWRRPGGPHVDVTEARAVLGVGDGDGWDVVRLAYRRRIAPPTPTCTARAPPPWPPG